MKAFVLGATTGLGRALCEELASKKFDLIISSSSKQDLSALSRHLTISYGVKSNFIVVNAADTKSTLRIIKADRNLSGLNAIFYPIGVSMDNDLGFLDSGCLDQIINANFKIIPILTSLFLPQIKSKKKAYIVGFGSISSTRGRSKNILYAASKRALDSYFESLMHLLQNTNIKVHYYKLGYLKSQQSFAKKLIIRPSLPKNIAREVILNLDKKSSISFMPKFWGFISLVVKLIPWPVYKKMDF
jgi:short-subunit dehydrogenase